VGSVASSRRWGESATASAPATRSVSATGPESPRTVRPAARRFSPPMSGLWAAPHCFVELPYRNPETSAPPARLSRPVKLRPGDHPRTAQRVAEERHEHSRYSQSSWHPLYTLFIGDDFLDGFVQPHEICPLSHRNSVRIRTINQGLRRMVADTNPREYCPNRRKTTGNRSWSPRLARANHLDHEGKSGFTSVLCQTPGRKTTELEA